MTLDEARAARVRRWADDPELCRQCGMRRINVVHEPDPEHAPEGKAYFDAIRDRLHPFRTAPKER